MGRSRAFLAAQVIRLATGHGSPYSRHSPHEEEVRAQLLRPAFYRIADHELPYLPYGELESHRESIARFGSGMKANHAVSRTLA